MGRLTSPFLVAASIAVCCVLLAGCSGVPGPGPSSSAPMPSHATSAQAALTATPTPLPTASAVPTPAPLPSGTVVSTTKIPKNCRTLLTNKMFGQLEAVPLNDIAFGPSGAMPDGSLRCVWGDPDADTTRLSTTVSYAPHNEVIDYLNALVAQGFTCYEPAGGIRCEATWTNPTYPVIDGRTLFYRDSVLVDTQYSNLAPAGYTASVIAAVWPPKKPSPSPTKKP